MVDTVPDMPALALAHAEGVVCTDDGHIQFEGLANTRDLGGIKGAGGRAIKRARLLRSGALAGATERDLKVLANDYNLRMVIDLRTEEERREKPDPQDALPEVTFTETPVLNMETLGVTRSGGLRGALKMLRAVQDNPAQVMMDIYPHMLLDEESVQGFTSFFNDVLATEEGAVLWHCTIGKDRAGLATVLLLHALGVPFDSIMRDYQATNNYVASRTQEIVDALAAYHLADKLDASIHVINSADPRFLTAALNAVDAEYGSLDSYLEQALGMTEEKRLALQARYLEEK